MRSWLEEKFWVSLSVVMAVSAVCLFLGGFYSFGTQVLYWLKTAEWVPDALIDHVGPAQTDAKGIDLIIDAITEYLNWGVALALGGVVVLVVQVVILVMHGEAEQRARRARNTSWPSP